MSNGKPGIWRLALAVLTGVLLAGKQEAWAGFFDPCVPPGDATIVVTEDTTVKNEAAILEDENFDDCTIEVADGVVLRLQNVVVSTTLDGRVDFDGGDTSSLIIKNSTLNVCDSDIFGFQEVSITHSTFVDPPDTTCDVKEMEPFGDITIIASVLTTRGEGDSDVQVTSQEGDVTVKNSTIVATDDVFIEAQTGNATVQASSVTANVDIAILGAGAVRAIANTLQAGGAVTITGNPCTSRANSPDVPCSP
jgi:hypothetical protein